MMRDAVSHFAFAVHMHVCACDNIIMCVSFFLNRQLPCVNCGQLKEWELTVSDGQWRLVCKPVLHFRPLQWEYLFSHHLPASCCMTHDIILFLVSV